LAEATREKIIKSARVLFGTRGLRSTTVDDIARGAGVSKRTVYETFPSKYEIARVIVDEALAAFEDNMRRIIQSGDDPLEKLRRLSRFYAAPQLSSIALVDLQRDLPELWERAETVENQILQEMHQVIDEGKKDGTFVDDISTDIVIGALTGALRTTMAPEFLLNSSHSIESVSDSLFELITRGILVERSVGRGVNKAGTGSGRARAGGGGAEGDGGDGGGGSRTAGSKKAGKTGARKGR
jgi:TetR/AcrR family transcriptional regulator, cholesterol catabolism regulator